MNFRNRNRKLLEQLPALRRYARALTGNQLMADELVQECYARACSKFNLWRKDSNLRSWLFTMMHNLYANQVRSQVSKPYLSPLDDEVLVASDNTESASGIELLGLSQALERLTAPQKEVLLLVCLEEMSYEEVARTLEIPIGTVMSRLSRARENLRQLMTRQSPAQLKRIK